MQNPLFDDHASAKPGALAQRRQTQVEEVLAGLLRLTRRRFRVAPEIGARLAEGATVTEMLLVLEHRTAMWGHDPRMRAYLRPSTIYRRGHWDDYLSAALAWAESGRPRLDGSRPTAQERVDAILEELGQ